MRKMYSKWDNFINERQPKDNRLTQLSLNLWFFETYCFKWFQRDKLTSRHIKIRVAGRQEGFWWSRNHRQKLSLTPLVDKRWSLIVNDHATLDRLLEHSLVIPGEFIGELLNRVVVVLDEFCQLDIVCFAAIVLMLVCVAWEFAIITWKKSQRYL